MRSNAWWGTWAMAGAAFVLTCVTCGCGRGRGTAGAAIDGGEDAEFVMPVGGSAPAPSGSTGVLTIRFPNPPEGAEVDVSMVGLRWRPTRFPARMGVPLGKPFTLFAHARDHYPFLRTFEIDPSTSAKDVTIELAEDRGAFGFRPSEIPLDAGIVPVQPPVEGFPAPTVFSLSTSSGGKGGGGGALLIDQQGAVWQVDAWLGFPRHKLLAWVDPYVFQQMLALRGEASEPGVVLFPPPRNKDGGSGSIWVYGTPVGDVELASNGDHAFRRASRAAGAIIVWMVAVQRDAIWAR